MASSQFLHDMVLYTPEDEFMKAYALLDPVEKRPRAITVKTDKGTISMKAGGDDTIYLDGEAVGRRCIQVQEGLEHMKVFSIYIPIRVTMEDEEREIIWTIKPL
jgi:hypothetical protein